MAGGYVSGPGDGLAVIREEISELRRRIAELEQPTATQMYGTTDQAAALAAAAVLPVTFFRLDSPLVSASLTEFAEVITPVPDGYTRALVNLTGTASLRNSGAAGSWALLVASPSIQGVAVNTAWASISGGQDGTATAAAAKLLTDLLPGDTVAVSVKAAFPVAYTTPRVSVAGSILFLK